MQIPSAEQIASTTRTLATLPDVFNRLQLEIRSTTSTVDDIAAVISSDPGLSARLLRLANSALYQFPGNVETISRALCLIGTRQLSELALATLIIDMFEGIELRYMSMRAFWRHSLATAVATRVLAIHCSAEDVERFYLAGLLHDVGRLVLFVDYPEQATEALRLAESSMLSVREAELKLFGFTDYEIGFHLLRQWQLSAFHQDSVRHCAAGEEAAAMPQGAALVHCGRWIARSLGMGDSGDRWVPPLTASAWEQLQILPSAMPRIVKDLTLQLADIDQVLLGPQP